MINGTYAKLFYQGNSARGAVHAHFSTEYERPRTRFGEDDRQRRAHKLAQLKLEERDVEIYNVTPGGKLDLFPRMDLKAALHE